MTGDSQLLFSTAPKPTLTPVAPRKFNVPIEKLNRAIERLEAPDPNSRNQEFEGRRIDRLDDRRDWGWQILNWKDYDKLRTRAEVAARVARHRAGKPASAATEPSESTYHPDSRTVLHLLNEFSGKSFRETDTNLGFISARLNENGVNLDGIKLMISRQCKIWKGTEREEYLRPQTLFNETKFDSYYAAKDQPIPPRDSTPQRGGNYQKPSTPLTGSVPNNGF